MTRLTAFLITRAALVAVVGGLLWLMSGCAVSTPIAHTPCMTGFELYLSGGGSKDKWPGSRRRADTGTSKHAGGGVTVYFDTTGACVSLEHSHERARQTRKAARKVEKRAERAAK